MWADINEYILADINEYMSADINEYMWADINEYIWANINEYMSADIKEFMWADINEYKSSQEWMHNVSLDACSAPLLHGYAHCENEATSMLHSLLMLWASLVWCLWVKGGERFDFLSFYWRHVGSNVSQKPFNFHVYIQERLWCDEHVLRKLINRSIIDL